MALAISFRPWQYKVARVIVKQQLLQNRHHDFKNTAN